MKLADYFEAKMPTSEAVNSEYWSGPYDRVLHDGKVWFYRLDEDVNAEDFAAAVAVAFEVDVDPRDVTMSSGRDDFNNYYRLDI